MNNRSMLPDEVVISKIYELRGQKIMLDRDLAELYGVKTKVLKQAVRRNLNRFPEDFMFEMTGTEFDSWRSQFVTSKEDKLGLRYKPFCFTEQGITMLSCVLSSPQAIEINIKIVRIFTKMRELLLTNKDIILQVEELRKKIGMQDAKLDLVFRYLKAFVKEKSKPVTKIGFNIKK